jgi:hypothetical protein
MEEKKTSTQKDESQDIKKKRKNLFETAKKYRKQFESNWEEYERFYNGKHWSAGQRRPVKNMVFSIVEQELAILTESRPGTDVIPLEIEQEDQAKVLQYAIDSVYDSERINIKLSQGIRESLVPGPSWLWVDYNHDAENGNGNVIIKNIPWRNVWIDPAADELDQADYAFIKIPMSVEKAQRIFPESKDKIKPVKSDQYPTVQDGRDPDRHRINDPVNSEVSRFESCDMTEIEEFWFKDYSMTDIPKEETQAEIEKEREELMNGINPDVHKYEDHDAHIKDHDGLKQSLASALLQSPNPTNEMIDMAAMDEQFSLIKTIVDDHIKMHNILKEENPKAKKPKYPSFWRRTVWCESEKLVDESPEVQDGMVPLVPIYSYKVLGSIYGEGEVKNIVHCQKSYNEMDYAEYKALKLNSNSGWVIDNNSGVDKTTLDNREGIVVEKNQGTQVQRLMPGTVSPQYQVRKAQDQRSMEEISGINEITQGRRPRGITAGIAIQAVRESSITRIRQKSRNIEEYTMLRLGQLVASRIIKYWSTERKLRVYDRNGQIAFISFEPEKMQDLKYQIRMSSGTTAGLDKESIFMLMKDLLVQGIIDRRAFFKVVDIPFKNEISTDMEETEQTEQVVNQLAQENEELKQVAAQVNQLQDLTPT